MPSRDLDWLEEPRVESVPHGFPPSAALTGFMATAWNEPASEFRLLAPPVTLTEARRKRLSDRFPGKRLVVAAGDAVVRSSDILQPFRPRSSFVWLTGLVGPAAVGAVLVMEPTGTGHDDVLFLRAPMRLPDPRFFSDHESGAFWVGPRPDLGAVAEQLGIECADVEAFKSRWQRDDRTLVLGRPGHDDRPLAEAVDELRLIKDPWEIEQLEHAIAATASAFTHVASLLPDAGAARRSERWVTARFDMFVKEAAAGVPSPTICASGSHACILHWTRSDGQLGLGDLLLIDGGAELDSLYASDITRTLPIAGSFSGAQREVYDVVKEAQDAAIAAVKPGEPFLAFHDAAVSVLRRGLQGWRILDATDADTDRYRRWTLTGGTGHMIGLDVHDCGRAPLSSYRDGLLREGMVLTVEPGIYFQPDDLLVPDQFRGIGIRIEDEVLVTSSGPRLLSADLPRDAPEVERLVRGQSPPH